MSNETNPPSVAIDLTSKMGVVDRATCIELIESTPVGRLGFTSDDGPLVLPVNFSWHEESIVFRTVEGQKLAAVAEGAPVCFEVDDWAAADHSGWSVVVRGTAREVTGWAEKEQLENIGLVPWSKEQWRPIWIRVDVDDVSGRVLR